MKATRVAVTAAGATVTLLAVILMAPPPSVLSDGTELASQPVTCTLPGDDTTAAGLNAEQTGNAATIIATGKSLGFPDQGLVVAIATAMQESTLVNLPGGDRDSVGLFQQRAPWGTFEERTTPATAATMFFTGGKGGQRGLEDIAGWEQLTVAEAAQAVQVSAFPMAYAKWEPLARTLVGGGLAVECDPGNVGHLPGRTVGEKAVNAALDQIGLPYSWGGGSYDGPTLGIAQGAHTVGFDCSGLTMYAWYQAAGIRLDHYTGNQAAASTPIPQSQAQAGDLIFFGSNGDYPHMGMYDGQGGMIHAPRTGKNVERVAGIFTDPYWSGRIGLIGRPPLPTNA